MLGGAIVLIVSLHASVPGPIGVRVQRAEGLDVSSALEIGEAVAGAIRTCTSSTTVVETFEWHACAAPEACVSEVRARLGVKDVVFLDLAAGPTRVLILAERWAEARRVRAEHRASLPFDGETKAMAPLALALYPEVVVVPPSDDVDARDVDTSRWVGPLAALGAAAVAVGVGAGFGRASRTERSRLSSNVYAVPERDARLAAARSDGTIANVLFVVAVAFGAGGLLALVAP